MYFSLNYVIKYVSEIFLISIFQLLCSQINAQETKNDIISK
jgi:hypothetical protein